MPRYDIKYKDKWACFSSISDEFITKFMEKDDYEKWRLEEYGRVNYKPAEKCNMLTMKEAVYSIRFYHRLDALDWLLECGLPVEECKKMLLAIELKYFCPTLKKNGKYECPICEEEVEKGQEVCENCKNKLTWSLEV